MQVVETIKTIPQKFMQMGKVAMVIGGVVVLGLGYFAFKSFTTVVDKGGDLLNTKTVTIDFGEGQKVELKEVKGKDIDCIGKVKDSMRVMSESEGDKMMVVYVVKGDDVDKVEQDLVEKIKKCGYTQVDNVITSTPNMEINGTLVKRADVALFKDNKNTDLSLVMSITLTEQDGHDYIIVGLTKGSDDEDESANLEEQDTTPMDEVKSMEEEFASFAGAVKEAEDNKYSADQVVKDDSVGQEIIDLIRKYIDPNAKILENAALSYAGSYRLEFTPTNDFLDKAKTFSVKVAEKGYNIQMSNVNEKNAYYIFAKDNMSVVVSMDPESKTIDIATMINQ